MNTSFKTKTLSQEVPPELIEETRSHDVILGRQNQRFFPTGSDGGKPGNIIRFELNSNSEWMDAKTAYLMMKITPSSTCDTVKGSLKNIIDGVEINIKGQSIQDTMQSSHLSVWTELKEKLYKSIQMSESNETLYGFNPGQTATGDSNNANEYLNQSSYTVALPLAEIVDFFNLNRSYLPVMALPITLNLRLAPTASVFYGTAAADYNVSEAYISADMLTMDQKLEESFRKSVMSGVVHFVYPSVFHYLKGNASSSDGIKMNLNTKCAESMFLVPMKTGGAANDNLVPIQTTSSITDASTFAPYVDSRAILSQPVNSTAQRMLELKKALKNLNNRYSEAPTLNGTSQLSTVIGANAVYNYTDVLYKIFGVNLCKQLDTESYSGLDLSMTGGRIFIQYSTNSAADVHLFVKTKAVLELTQDFIQVIR